MLQGPGLNTPVLMQCTTKALTHQTTRVRPAAKAGPASKAGLAESGRTRCKGWNRPTTWDGFAEILGPKLDWVLLRGNIAQGCLVQGAPQGAPQGVPRKPGIFTYSFGLWVYLFVGCVCFFS